ncbi:MAG: hypothetical protein ACI37Q_08820 [Candidatus Gastranaerophilaceae bacterium]
MIESPKSYQDLQEIFYNHKYLKENISVDTLRIYLNSLREIGCDIKRITENNVTKYYISEHPFRLKITEKQVKSIVKVYKAISKSIDINDLMAIQKFFDKISQSITNTDLKEKLNSISPFNNIKPEIFEELKFHAENNNEITIYYNSLNSGKKDITILVDKFSISNGKLYICGFNSEYKNYSNFLVSRIQKIVSVNLEKKKLEIPDIVAGYEYKKDTNIKPDLLKNEKIISEDDNKYIIEITSKNKFEIIQRIMSHTNKCKLLYPENIKEEIIMSLKKMKEGYIDVQ